LNFRLAYTYLALKSIKGISDETVSKALGRLGTLDGVFDLGLTELAEAGFNQRQAQAVISRNVDRKFVENQIRLAGKHNIDITTLEEGGYPPMLREIYAPPAVLFSKGRLEPLRMPCIAVVGSRNASRSSMAYTEKLAEDLAEVGFNVVSGFAAGVDIHAHRGALKKGYTTAVLGNGLMSLYPEANARYAAGVCESGCFLSEFPLDEPPHARNFPIRNRIISGISHGVVVIEASTKSGSLITARYANEQGREVFAVPASPDCRNRATNDLIRNGARLIESYYDVVEEFSPLLPRGKFIDKQEECNIVFDSPEKHKIYNLLAKGPLNRDELCITAAMKVGDMMVILSELELEGVIVCDIDGKYRINGGAGGKVCDCT
jgi:DNA processing protein